jgi:CubicO group peptidase (beta-lactamase class C family)
VAGVPEIHGSCDPRFTVVREALAENFRERGEVGAAVSLTLEGRPVVEIWGGWTDGERRRPWRRDTLVDVFSVGKAMAATCLLMMVEEERLDLDAPVARLWPGFAAAGKEAVTTRWVLAHRAGLPGIRQTLPELAMYEWETMTEALAAETPWWQPGRLHGYHVNTFGFLVGEIVRRAAGITVAELFRRRVAEPLGADFHFGLRPGDQGRVAEFLLEAEPPPSLEAPPEDPVAPEDPVGSTERAELLRCVYLNPPGISGLGTVNTSAWRAAEMPSTNGHATAAAIARIYSALACGGAVDGVRLLEAGTIEAGITEHSCGPDYVLGRPSRFGLGFQLTQPERPLGPGPRGFGHFGAGGSLGFADPDRGLAFGYVMNRAGPSWQNPRNRALIDAVYASL